MEIVRIPGYLETEKLAIAERFLVPRQLRECGLDPATAALAPGVLPAICAAGRARPACATSSGASAAWRASSRGGAPSRSPG